MADMLPTTLWRERVDAVEARVGSQMECYRELDQ